MVGDVQWLYFLHTLKYEECFLVAYLYSRKYIITVLFGFTYVNSQDKINLNTSQETTS